jgi:tRNA (mo5U34)-methyltransferase
MALQKKDMDKLMARARAQRWFHRIRLSDDFVTPGPDDTAAKLANLEALGLPQDLTGKRVLDIGAWDGFFSFEMERRGAEVVALDHVEKEATGFVVASEILDSKVTWKTSNIYDLDPEELGYFDVVLCLGVIYHLRHIILGMDRVRGVMKPGANLYIETAGIDHHVLGGNGTFMPLVSAGPAGTGPLLQLYAEGELGKDGSNFFAPNAAGLEALLRATEFKVDSIKIGPTGFPTRIIARARAVHNPGVVFHRERDTTTLSQREGFAIIKATEDTPDDAPADTPAVAPQPAKAKKFSLRGLLKGN